MSESVAANFQMFYATYAQKDHSLFYVKTRSIQRTMHCIFIYDKCLGFLMSLFGWLNMDIHDRSRWKSKKDQEKDKRHNN